MATKASAEVTVTDRTDATAIRAWYHAQTSAVAPSAPTTTSASATPSGWTLAEPTVSGAADLSKYVYRCEQLVWGDGTCDWGTVTLSASYEAAKVAYNKAVAAAGTANRYVTELSDGIFVAPEGQGPNDTATPTGWRIRDALELIKSGVSAFRVWLENSVAKVRVGEEGQSHMELDGHSLKMVDSNDGTYLHVSDVYQSDREFTWTDHLTGNGSDTEFPLTYFAQAISGRASDLGITVTLNGSDVSSSVTLDRMLMIDEPGYSFIKFQTAPASGAEIVVTYPAWSNNEKAFTFGTRGDGDIGPMSTTFGEKNVASGVNSFASGVNCTAVGEMARATGRYAVANGNCSNAEGSETIADYICAHAEGYRSKALGPSSHAEGDGTTASASFGHSEGSMTTAGGRECSHAEGYLSKALNDCTHAQNRGTIAASNDQTAIGRWNEEDANDTYALIVGNGTSYINRSNAFAVTWDGIPYARNPANTFGSVFDLVYPVGAIYMSTVSTSPATLFGGTWERITGRFLLAATDGGAAGGNSNASIAAGNTGGEATHTLTSGESGVPAHAHGMQSHTHTTNIGHGHGFTQPTITVKRGQVAASGSATYVPASNGSNSVTNVASASGGSVTNYTGSKTSGGPSVANTANNTAANASSAHNNMPPYLAVYVWKRTA